jgi:iron complex outermembrane receptor protein
MYIPLRSNLSLLAAAAAAVLVPSAYAQSNSANDNAPVVAQSETDEVVIVNARRREEDIQSVPVAVSAIPLEMIEATGSYNVAQLTQLTPSVQFFSSNPRNTAITIRGLGTSFGLTNDGLESGVGYYIDQVYYSRPAATTFDLIDIGQVEVLRGPQGTLFGKNTTAGVINVGIQIPTFERETQVEASYGNYSFIQGKASISGPLIDNLLAFRLSASGTLREGTVFNVTSGQEINDQNNFAARFQLLYRPSLTFSLRFSGDYNMQESICCAQGFVTVAPTLKPASQQFPAMAASLGYAPASLDPFDRLIDTNTRAQANQVLGGASVIADWDIGPVTLTSVSAWRTWNWAPANDRDFTALSVQTKSVNPDNQNQYSQEFRVTSNGVNTVDYVAGLYFFRQLIDATPTAEYGEHGTRWLLPQFPTLPSDLLDGYLVTADAHSDTKSYAGFAQLTWHVTDRLHFTPGLRYTYEDKFGSFDQVVSGGLATNDPTLIARKQSIARPQFYEVDFSEDSLSGLANLSYDITPDIMGYVSYSRGFKSGGINLAGIPTDAQGNPIFTTARIKPEKGNTYEVGLKTQFFGRTLTANLAAFYTTVEDYQVNVVDSGPGALRGYLSNVDKVSSKGVELDAAWSPIDEFSSYLSLAWTEGKYESFTNGPCPIERIGASTAACDLSGRPLPGLPKWAISFGGEYRTTVFDGTAYLGFDATYRSDQYSDASNSQYLVIDAYTLVNVRAGWVSPSGVWEGFVWVRNAFDTRYFQYMSVQPGNSGAIAALLGDPRTYGFTLRVRF